MDPQAQAEHIMKYYDQATEPEDMTEAIAFAIATATERAGRLEAERDVFLALIRAYKAAPGDSVEEWRAIEAFYALDTGDDDARAALGGDAASEVK